MTVMDRCGHYLASCLGKETCSSAGPRRHALCMVQAIEVASLQHVLALCMVPGYIASYAQACKLHVSVSLPTAMAQ